MSIPNHTCTSLIHFYCPARWSMISLIRTNPLFIIIKTIIASQKSTKQHKTSDVCEIQAHCLKETYYSNLSFLSTSCIKSCKKIYAPQVILHNHSLFFLRLSNLNKKASFVTVSLRFPCISLYDCLFGCKFSNITQIVWWRPLAAGQYMQPYTVCPNCMWCEMILTCDERPLLMVGFTGFAWPGTPI